MPVFYRMEDFNRWYAARGQRQSKWTAQHPAPALSAPSSEASGAGTALSDTSRSAPPTPSSGLLVALTELRERGQDLDFDARQAAQAESAVDAVWALYLDACESGDPLRVAAALRNWSEASKQAQAVRDQFLKLLERSGSLLDWEKAVRVVEQELLALRRLLVKLPDRLACEVNPDDPELARRVLVGDVEKILAAMAEAVPAIRQELETEIAANQA